MVLQYNVSGKIKVVPRLEFLSQSQCSILETHVRFLANQIAHSGDLSQNFDTSIFENFIPVIDLIPSFQEI